ncbi:MAG: RHS repeat-associated core domain-containing protein, partial [Lysobacter sp.]|nr:RHS repeat-associated core domain-containing protein [Lysobacter sp.]
LHYIEADHLGTPRVVIDPQRDVAVWRWELTGEAFGDSAPNQDPDGDVSEFVFNVRFPGQRYDAASGLNQNGFRDYEAATGRYPQSDPIGLNGGLATFAYALSNPLLYSDPLGLAPATTAPGTWFPDPAPRPWNIPWDRAAPICRALSAPLLFISLMTHSADAGSCSTVVNKPSECNDDDRCEKAKADARRAYSKLMSKRFPQFQSGGTRGRDTGHLQAIIQLQTALQDALRRVRMYCAPLPAEYWEWERAALLNAPGF